MDDRRRDRILSEHILDELKTIHELVAHVPSINARLTKLEEDVATIKQDVSLLKRVVREHSLAIARLEAKLA